MDAEDARYFNCSFKYMKAAINTEMNGISTKRAVNDYWSGRPCKI
jgi:hypothetical protein